MGRYSYQAHGVCHDDRSFLVSNYSQRVGERAQQIQVVRLVLAVLAAPLYALGWLVGILVVALLWLLAATAVGFSDARARSRRPD